jgi:hypothetical protein
LFAPFKDAVRSRDAAGLSLSISGSSGSGFRITSGGQTLSVSHSVLEVITRAITEINTTAVAGLRLLAIHAGVVASGSGVVAFPAPSAAGKSTLTAASVLAGLDYLSDEALILTEEGTVMPYPKPLSLSAQTRRMLGLGSGDWPGSDGKEVAMTAADLGGSIGRGDGELRHVVMLRRGAHKPTLLRLPSVEIVSALLGHSFNHYLRPEAAYRLACRLAEKSEIWRLTFDHPRPAAELIKERLTA